MIKKLFANMGSTVSVYIARLVVTFIMTPIYVRNLGNYDYGVWEIIFVIVGYMGILDLGIKPAVARFASYYKAKNDSDSLNRIFSTAFFYMFVLGLLSTIGLITTGIFWPNILAQDADNVAKYTWLFIIMGLHVSILFPGQIFESFLEGYQQFVTKNFVSILLLLLNSLIIYIFINTDNALLLLAGVSTISVLFKYGIYYLILHLNRTSSLHFKFRFVTRATILEIFSFSIKTFLAALAYRLNQSIDIFLIGALSGIETIVYFSIPYALIRYANHFVQAITSVYMPLFADLHSRNEKQKLKSIYIIASKLLYSINALLLVGVILVGDNFILYWVGADYSGKGSVILLCVSLTLLVDDINILGGRYLPAIGKHGVLAVSETIRVSIRFPLAAILIYYFGYAGAAYSFFAHILTVYYVLKKVCGYIEINMVDYITSAIMPSALPIIVLCIAIKIASGYIVIHNFLTLFTVAIVGTVCYIATFMVFGIKKSEYELFNTYLLTPFRK